LGKLFGEIDGRPAGWIRARALFFAGTAET
jgi:hypothetical protein